MKSESLKYILPSLCDPCSESISLAASALLLNSMSEQLEFSCACSCGAEVLFPSK